MNNFWILAMGDVNQAPSIQQATRLDEKEETAATKVPSDPNNAAQSKQPQPKGLFGGYDQIIIIGLLFVVMYFVLLRGPRKRQQEHKHMVHALKKNDKVRTIGGIVGTIVDIKDDEITLKVDESNNTKIRVIPSAIAMNLSDEKNK
jgi:preprotein translocase subunit YajC